MPRVGMPWACQPSTTQEEPHTATSAAKAVKPCTHHRLSRQALLEEEDEAIRSRLSPVNMFRVLAAPDEWMDGTMRRPANWAALM